MIKPTYGKPIIPAHTSKLFYSKLLAALWVGGDEAALIRLLFERSHKSVRLHKSELSQTTWISDQQKHSTIAVLEPLSLKTITVRKMPCVNTTANVGAMFIYAMRWRPLKRVVPSREKYKHLGSLSKVSCDTLEMLRTVRCIYTWLSLWINLICLYHQTVRSFIYLEGSPREQSRKRNRPLHPGVRSGSRVASQCKM